MAKLITKREHLAYRGSNVLVHAASLVVLLLLAILAWSFYVALREFMEPIAFSAPYSIDVPVAQKPVPVALVGLPVTAYPVMQPSSKKQSAGKQAVTKPSARKFKSAVVKRQKRVLQKPLKVRRRADGFKVLEQSLAVP